MFTKSRSDEKNKVCYRCLWLVYDLELFTLEPTSWLTHTLLVVYV